MDANYVVIVFALLTTAIHGNFTSNSNTSSTSLPCVPEEGEYYYTERDYPNPRRDIGRCGRGCKASYVCDPNGILTPMQAANLDKSIDDLRRSSFCHCECSRSTGGVQVAVALMNRMNPKGRSFSRSQLQTQVKNFASYIRVTAWNFGFCYDNIVIMVSKEDRKVYTSTGTTTKRTLTDECVMAIYEKTKQNLTDGNFYRGVSDMIDQYKLALTEEDYCPSLTAPNLALIIPLSIIGGIFGIIVCICLYCCCCRGGGSGGGGGGYSSRGGGYRSGGGHSSWGGGGGGGGGGGDSGGGGGGDF